MNNYDLVRKKLLKFAHMGTERNETCTLIGHQPYYGSLAYLNIMYAPMPPEVLGWVKHQFPMDLPKDYEYFLSNFSNGLDVMLQLFLFGERTTHLRLLAREDFRNRQPWSVWEFNTVYGYPENIPEYALLIGCYASNGSRLYMMPDDPKVYFCRKHDATPLMSWNSLYEMIDSEIDRLYSLFDENGLPLDPDALTTPV